jgi:hypothetical protein
MPTADLSASPAVQIAWKIAAGTAKSSGGSIKPSDFLYGIFSLDKIAASDLPSESRADTVAEIAELEQRCSLASVDFRDIRRKIRGEATKSSSSVDAKAISGGGQLPDLRRFGKRSKTRQLVRTEKGSLRFDCWG